MSHLATPACLPARPSPAREVSAPAIILTVLAVFAMVVVILAYAAHEGSRHDADALAAEARLAAQRGESIPVQVVRSEAARAGTTRSNQSTEERP